MPTYKCKAANLWFILICLNISSVTKAAEQLDHTTSTLLKKGHLLIQLGGLWENAGKTQHINIAELIGNTYTSNKQTSSNALVGVGYFLESQTIRVLQLSYGLNWFYLPKTSYDGTVTQENMFTNLSYRYEVSHYPLYAMVKSTTAIGQTSKYALTVDMGIGPNFMKTAHYRETAINNNSVPDTAFPGKTTTTFSATVGGGIKRNGVFGDASLECGYRFFYLGQGQFNRISNQLNTFTTGQVYANAVLCSLMI